MTYKELLELLAEQNMGGNMPRNLFKGISDFFRGGFRGGGHSAFPQYPSKIYTEKQDRPIKSTGLQQQPAINYGPFYQGKPTQALEPAGYPGAMYSDGMHTSVWYNGELYSAEEFWNMVGGKEGSQFPQYPSKIYPERTGGGMEPIPYEELPSEKRRLLDERQAYTQALIPINETLSYTDGSRSHIYDSSTGEVYPAEGLYNNLGSKTFPQYPSGVYPDKTQEPILRNFTYIDSQKGQVPNETLLGGPVRQPRDLSPYTGLQQGPTGYYDDPGAPYSKPLKSQLPQYSGTSLNTLNAQKDARRREIEEYNKRVSQRKVPGSY